MKERSIAGGLGAVMGLLFAISLEWSVVGQAGAILVGASVGFFSHEPMEIFATGVRILRNVFDFSRFSQALLVAPRVPFVAFCGAVFVASLLATPTVATLALFPEQLNTMTANFEKTADLIGMMLLVTCLPGVLGYLLLMSNSHKQNSKWWMPATRWMHQKWSNRLVLQDQNPGKVKIVTVCALVPLLMPWFGLLWLIILPDFLISLVLACATTKRLASTMSATIGVCMGMMLHLVVGGSVIPLVIGGIAGLFAAPVAFRLRERLEGVPVTA